MACPPITAYVERASFGVLSREDIKQISVKKITEPKSFEKAGKIHEEGLYSHALGPIKRFETCTTCGLSDLNCPGHFGHIELSVPVFNPMLVQTLFQILNKCCVECYHLRLSPTGTTLFLTQLEALNYGFDHLVDDLDDVARDICRDEKATDDEYTNVLLRNKLNQMIKEEKEKTPNVIHEKRPQQRSIVERLSRLFRNFINGQLIKPLKKCPNCNEKKTTTSLHQQSVIVVGSGSSKPLNDDDGEAKERFSSVRKRRSKKGHLMANHLEILQANDKKFITPVGARKIMRLLWKNEKHTMERLFHFLNLNEAATKTKKEEDDEIAQDEEDNVVPKLKTEDQSQPTDLFFIDTLIVTPSKFRPPMTQRGYTFEGPRTASLSTVMKLSVIVEDFINQLSAETDGTKADRIETKLQAHWKDLQVAVNSLYDNEMDKYGKNKYPGLKQLIDKKEGLFRKNMMGKRVNFAARSVISPDPNISVDQIGVPLVFAKKLTYPQPVTPWNIKHLREAVLNGPDKYPGATSIVFDDGVTLSLTKESVRQSIAPRLSYNPRYNPKFRKSKQDSPMVTIVNRHLLNDDVLLFNRQPTLHKCSIMAFRARVLPNEKGFRLHYANCKSFNADFDGDEMNAHLPQSELARSEAYNIASVNHQYLVPKDGSPLGGLIQDHVIAVCILTQRDQFFDKERYHQLVYCALAFLERGLDLEPPAIIKPEPVWTGKQVITTIIRNCIPRGKLPPTVRIKSKIGAKILNISPKYEDLSDCNVYIKDGELLTGFMDKSNVGATQYGLVHTCYELYGGETSSNLMSAFARLSTWYLQLYEGFTLGIADILVEDDANHDRHMMIRESRVVGPDSAKEALNIEEEVSEETLENRLREAHSDRDPLPMKKLDAAMKKRTDNISSNISSRCLPASLIRKFPDNNLQMMIQSGAKGGTVNALQISCLLGQIELEGRRVPLSMSGRTLPSFKPYDTSPKAGGFVSGRFLTGIQPQEFFFHCMAGREGLIDTAVKTSRSGYLQRCLIKHLEGLSVHYDQTVRDSCGSVIQFLYGEDGLDIVKSQMLKEKAFSSLIENYKILSPGEAELKQLNKLKEAYEDDVIAATESIQQWLDRNGENRVQKIRGSGFLDFQSALLNDPEQYKQFVADRCILEEAESNLPVKEEKKELAPVSVSQSQMSPTKSKEQIRKRDRIRQAWYALTFKEKRKWNKDWDTCPDPLISLMNPGSHFGVVPEKLDEMIEKFVEKNPHLVVNSASLIGHDGTIQQSLIDANPELSKTIFAYWDQLPGFHVKPKLTKHEFYNLCYNLFMKMLAQPGEAVGLLAAQSIGEPSTQMTLNTFHFAGRGEMNVTLGIPRLREILMTASAKIGTPSMDLPLLPVMHDMFGNELSVEETEEQAQRVKLALNAVRLSDVLEFVEITEQVVEGKANSKQTPAGKGRGKSRKSTTSEATDLQGTTGNSLKYSFLFSFLPRKYYEHEFRTKSKKVLQFMEEVFILQLVDRMKKRQMRLLLAESMFDLSSRRANVKDRVSKSSGENEGGVAPTNDVEEQELDSYNAEQKAKEKARDDESSSDEDDDGEGDNTTARMKNRRNPELDYEEAEEDDLEVGDIDAKAAELEENDKEVLADDDEVVVVATKGLQTKKDEDNVVVVAVVNAATDQTNDSSSPDFKGDEINALIATDDDEEDKNLDKKAKKKRDKVDQATALERIQKVKSLPNVEDYEFDRKHQRWCQVTLVLPQYTSRLDVGALIEAEAKSTFVHRVGNIHRAFLVKDVGAKSRGAKCDSMIKTEGVSLLSLVKFNHIIDLNAIYSNDIHAIANTYGIEAASQAIRREMANVFAVYGIEVDPRHLSLIADYMTYNGAIRGMNRMSMEASASPFQQMSFESTIRYLKLAAILGLRDDIKSPSAALVFGRPTRGGTGILGTLMQEDCAPPNSSRPIDELDNFGGKSRRRPYERVASSSNNEEFSWNPPEEKRAKAAEEAQAPPPPAEDTTFSDPSTWQKEEEW